MTSPFRKVLSAGLAVLMTATVATSASAALINTEQLKYDSSQALKRVASDTADAAKFNLASQKADGIWSSQFSKNGQTAYMLMVKAIQNFQTSASIPDVPKSEFNQFWNIMKKEHPELFYAKNFQRKTLTEENGHAIYTATWTLDSNARQEVNAVNQAVSQFLAQAPTNGSDYDKELYVHDKLVQDTNYVSGNRTVYNSMVEHKGNCEGYAYAMKILLNQLNVPCEVIVGTATGEGAHAWNRVTLSGKQYLTDACWDDPVGKNGSHIVSHRYFNLSASEMNRDHKATQNSEQSGCTNTDQNYYKKNGLYYSSVAEAEQAISSQMQTKTSIQVQVPSSDMANQIKQDWKSGKLNMPAGSHWHLEQSNTQNGFANGVLIFYSTAQ